MNNIDRHEVRKTIIQEYQLLEAFVKKRLKETEKLTRTDLAIQKILEALDEDKKFYNNILNR